MRNRILIVLFYLIPVMVLWTIVDKTSQNILVEIQFNRFLGVILIIFLFIEHLKAPKIPDIKPYLILPNSSKILVGQAFKLIYFDINKWFLFFPLLACIHFKALVHTDFQLIVYSVSLIILYFALLLHSWRASIAIRYNFGSRMFFKTLFLSFILFCFLLSMYIFNYNPILLLLFSFLFLIAIYVLSIRNLEDTLRSVFDPIEKSTKSNRIVHFETEKLYFVKKELRMCFRTRRLKWGFIFTFFSSILVGSMLLLNTQDKAPNYFLYFAVIALAMTFGDYYERFWGWDSKNNGLIITIPNGKSKYFYQKLLYVLFIELHIFPLHFLLFPDKPLALLVAFSLIFSVPVLAGFNSMKSNDREIDLNASIWDVNNMRFSINQGLTLIPLLFINWFIIISDNKEILILYVLVLISFTMVLVKKLWEKFDEKEWSIHGT